MGCSLNSYQRFLRRLDGKPVDRPPNFNIMMAFAAHDIGEPLSAYYQDFRVLCRANIAVRERYALDIVQTISDPYREAVDLGLDVNFPHDNLPFSTNPLLTDLSDIGKIQPGITQRKFGRRMNDRLNAVQSFRQTIGNETPIMGWVEGPMAEAGVLRGVSQFLSDVYDHSKWVEELLDLLFEFQLEFACAQVQAGADIIGLGDAICSQISPSMYRKFALPFQKRIFDAVHKMNAITRLHICGNTSHLLRDMAESGADIIDLDWMVDLKKAFEIFREKPVICGNFDPVKVMLQGTPEQVYQSTINCLDTGGPRLISGAGCEIPEQTPTENLFAQIRALENYQTGLK